MLSDTLFSLNSKAAPPNTINISLEESYSSLMLELDDEEAACTPSSGFAVIGVKLQSTNSFVQ